MRLETTIRQLKRYLRDVDRAIETFEAAAERELARKCSQKPPESVDYSPVLIWDSSLQDTGGGRTDVKGDAVVHSETSVAA